MKAKKATTSLIALLAASTLALGACSDAGSTPKKAETATSHSHKTDDHADHAHGNEKYPEGVTESTKKASLDDWAGTHRSYSTYVDEPELAPAFEQKAAESGETVEQVKDAIKARATAFSGMVITDKNITFVKDLANLAAPTEKPIEYTFDKALDVKTDKKEYTWFIFKSKEEAGDYTYVSLMPIHGEEVMAHYHMRYGKDMKAILEPENKRWFPTFVDPQKVTLDQVAKAITRKKKH